MNARDIMTANPQVVTPDEPVPRAEEIVRDHMTVDRIAAVLPADDVSEVIARMGGDEVRRIPVIESDGRLAGMFARADLAVTLGSGDPLEVEEALERISEPAHAVR